MKPITRLLLIALATLWLPPVAAEDQRPWYRLEVILFAQGNLLDALESERWPDEYVQAEAKAEEEERSPESVVVVRGLDISRAAETAEPAEEAAPLPEEFIWLKDEELQLGEAVARLRADSSMKLLWHGGWVQPGLEREAALPVGISLPREEPLVDENGQPLAYTPPPLLEGELRLVLSRYLHIEADLGYLLPVDPERVILADKDKGIVEEQPTAVYGDAAMSEEMAALALATLSIDERDALLRQAELSTLPHWQVFHLRDSRRMRSGETHYLDHPLFGMVVQALPLEMSPADAAAALEARELENVDAEVVIPATLTAPR